MHVVRRQVARRVWPIDSDDVECAVIVSDESPFVRCRTGCQTRLLSNLLTRLLTRRATISSRAAAGSFDARGCGGIGFITVCCFCSGRQRDVAPSWASSCSMLRPLNLLAGKLICGSL